jgi:hypothetical protein
MRSVVSSRRDPVLTEDVLRGVEDRDPVHRSLARPPASPRIGLGPHHVDLMRD